MWANWGGLRQAESGHVEGGTIIDFHMHRLHQLPVQIMALHAHFYDNIGRPSGELISAYVPRVTLTREFLVLVFFWKLRVKFRTVENDSTDTDMCIGQLISKK